MLEKHLFGSLVPFAGFSGKQHVSHKVLRVGVEEIDNHIIFVRQNGRNNQHFAVSLLFTALRILQPQ